MAALNVPSQMMLSYYAMRLVVETFCEISEPRTAIQLRSSGEAIIHTLVRNRRPSPTHQVFRASIFVTDPYPKGRPNIPVSTYRAQCVDTWAGKVANDCIRKKDPGQWRCLIAARTGWPLPL